MAIDLARLRSVMRGEIVPKNGVAGVAGVSLPRQKSPELRQLRPLRLKNAKGENDAISGVAEDVAAALRPTPFPLEVHRCACGNPAVIGVGWFLKQPDTARWFCGKCYPAERKAEPCEGGDITGLDREKARP
jgi:hypothetical protein